MNFISRWFDSGKRPRDFQSLKEINAKKLALEILTGDNSPQTMPQWVGFSTTYFCNLRCPHCQTHGTEETRALYNRQHWPYELILRLAAETLPTAYQFCLTLNGEPLATPRLTDVLANLQPYGAKLHLTTNGILMSKEVLIKLLPFTSTIGLSIDGGTKRVVEGIRLGTNFEKLLTRIRVLTRSCELLCDIIKPYISFAYTLMASNIRDMPELIRLAHLVGVKVVEFYPLHVFYPHIAEEKAELYAPLYNAYYYRTLEEAQRLGIHVSFFLPLFPGIEPNPEFNCDGKNRLVSLPKDYYETLPLPESYIPLERIEAEATDIASSVRDSIAAGAISLSATSKPVRSFQRILGMQKHKLSELAKGPDVEIPWCLELATKAFINSSGDVTPCCMPERPVFGNVHTETVSQIWNGKQRVSFWQQFNSSTQPDCCKNCRMNVRVSRRSVMAKMIPTSN